MPIRFPDHENVPCAYSVHDLARTAGVDPRTAARRLIKANISPVVVTGNPDRKVRLFLLETAWPALIARPMPPAYAAQNAGGVQ